MAPYLISFESLQLVGFADCCLDPKTPFRAGGIYQTRGIGQYWLCDGWTHTGYMIVLTEVLEGEFQDNIETQNWTKLPEPMPAIAHGSLLVIPGNPVEYRYLSWFDMKAVCRKEADEKIKLAIAQLYNGDYEAAKNLANWASCLCQDDLGAMAIANACYRLMGQDLNRVFELEISSFSHKDPYLILVQSYVDIGRHRRKKTK